MTSHGKRIVLFKEEMADEYCANSLKVHQIWYKYFDNVDYIFTLCVYCPMKNFKSAF